MIDIVRIANRKKSYLMPLEYGKGNRKWTCDYDNLNGWPVQVKRDPEQVRARFRSVALPLWTGTRFSGDLPVPAGHGTLESAGRVGWQCFYVKAEHGYYKASFGGWE